MLKLIGFWTDTKFKKEKWIHPKRLVDSSWEADRREKIVEYLNSGHIIYHELGYSYCRFSDGPADKEMGSGYKADGVWSWPEGLAVYIEKYHVRLPDEFIKHMAANDFMIPLDLDVEKLRNMPVQTEFWKIWCKKQWRNWLLNKILFLFGKH